MKFPLVLVGLSCAVCAVAPAVAQNNGAPSSAPAVLQITREFVKPYKNGAAHDKSESNFSAAMAKAKFPAHYVGMISLSGKSRSLFFTDYPSFAEWQKDNEIVDKNAALGAELERAGIGDGDLLDELDSVVYTSDADLSYHSRSDLQGIRFYEISVFHVRPGHRSDWHTIVKMVKDANDKAATSNHWGMYEVAYGAPDGTYIAITGDDSMAAIDKSFSESKKWIEAMGGEEGMAKFDKLFGEAVDESRTELFAVNPKQSYVPDEWIKADPGFWKPKAAAAAPAKAAPAAKPAGN